MTTTTTTTMYEVERCFLKVKNNKFSDYQTFEPIHNTLDLFSTHEEAIKYIETLNGDLLDLNEVVLYCINKVEYDEEDGAIIDQDELFFDLYGYYKYKRYIDGFGYITETRELTTEEVNNDIIIESNNLPEVGLFENLDEIIDYYNTDYIITQSYYKPSGEIKLYAIVAGWEVMDDYRDTLDLFNRIKDLNLALEYGNNKVVTTVYDCENKEELFSYIKYED